jgi:short-subunit dehydrogenase
MYGPVEETPGTEARALFDLNFFAPLALSQEVIPHLRARGSGIIVNVGSIAGHVSLPWMPLYSASKSALATLTETLRMELAPAGIHVMLVSPGYVQTSFQEHSRGTPPPRVAAGKTSAITPDQCAAAILRGIERRPRMVVTPRWGWFLIAMHRLMPRVVEARLMQMSVPITAREIQ